MKALKEGDFQFFDKPRDSSCPGFTLNGYTLRWVSGGVEARRAGRMVNFKGQQDSGKS